MIEAIMQEESQHFLNVTPKSTTMDLKLMNKGIESAPVSWNAITNTRHYVADKNPTTTYTGDAKQLNATQYAYKNDGVFEFVDDIFFYEKKGSDAETDIIDVFIYRAEEGSTSYPAKKSRCIIVKDTNGGDGGDQYSVAYNVMYNGDPIFGVLTIDEEGNAMFTETAE